MRDVVLRTGRLGFRRLLPDDAEAMFALDADAEVRRYLPDAAPVSIEDVRQRLVEYQAVYRDDGFARWAVIEDATGEWLGWCGLRRQKDGEVDVGYRFRRATWGRGFATEGASACLAHGFQVLGLPRITAVAHTGNARSIRVLEKIGLRFERETTLEGAPAGLWALERRAWASAVAPSPDQNA